MSQTTFSGPVSGHNFSSFTVNDGSVNVNNYGSDKPAVRSYIPYPRNEDIVLRPDITTLLESRLPLQHGAQSAALCGLGGSGKTQIALQYAYDRCSDKKTSVFWVHAENEATFSHDYQCIANMLGLNISSLTGADMLQAVSIGIQKQSPWVLVVDNADNLGLFGIGNAAKTMRPYIPAGPGGTVLWTTRDEQILGTLVGTRRGIKVDRMTDGEAKELLSVARGGDPLSLDDEQATEALLKELQWLPLAVFQAGAYMRESLTDTTKYLELLRQGQKRWEVLKESYNDPHRRPGVTNSVLATWSISIQYIKQQNKLAYEILHIAAYLDNQKIQQGVLQEAGVVASLGTANQEQQDDEIAIGRAIKRLSDFSFLTRRSDGEGELSYEMHKLVQEGIRYQLRVGQTPKDGQSCHQEYKYLLSALAVVEFLFPDYLAHEVGLWDQCEKYLAHCIQLAGFADILIRGGGTLGVHLFQRAGLYAISRVMLRQAEMLHGAAWMLLREQLGDNDQDVLYASIALAVIHQYLGRFDEAEKSLIQVLQTGKQTLGEEHQVVLRAMHHLASLQRDKGYYNEAERLFVQVHRIHHETLGEMHQITIDSASAVANIHSRLGHYAKAKEMLVRILEQCRQILGEMHPDTIKSAEHLAAIHHNQGDYKKAQEMRAQVFEQHRQLFGEMHPSTINSASNLATTYYKRGDYTKAAEMQIKVLEQCRQLWGDMHPQTIDRTSDLAMTYLKQGHFIQAKEMGIQVLAYHRQLYGELHPQTIISAANLATVHEGLGELDEAGEIYKSALEKSLQLLGEMHPQTLRIKHDMARLRFSQGQFEEANMLIQECLVGRRELLGLTHPHTEYSERLLARIKEAHTPPT